MFSKKHYEKIALVMKSLKPPKTHDTCDCVRQWSLTVSNLSTMFERDNSKFNALKFHKATGALE